MAPCTTWGARLPRTLRGSWRRERDVLIRFAPSASLRSPNQFPSQGRGRFSSLITKITILNTDALNYVEFRPAMHPTWCMAEREGFEPSIPLLAGYTISNRAPSASRASLHFKRYAHCAKRFYIIWRPKPCHEPRWVHDWS